MLDQMLDHMGFRVRDLAASRRFYDACAAPLGLTTIDNSDQSFLIGRSAEQPLPFIWVGTAMPAFWTPAHKTSAAPIHLAFAARDRAAVNAFYTAALAAGGIDNGAPGLRGPEAMKYYAAFVLDPDGNNIEAGVRE
jgi:catechol 2,3-dioxygenase-like lactoylglutathione lyase family enzyme